jgi:hypothetical protein
MTQDAAPETETWESTTEGTVWVHVKDARVKSGWNVKRVGGPGSGTRKVTLTTEERQYNQDQVLDDNYHLDPFLNGQLVCVKGRPATDKGRYELSDADMLAILAIESDEVFTEAVDAIEIELPLRRLLALAEKHAPMVRYEQIKTLIDTRYRVGWSQRSVREMDEAADGVTGHRLSG